MLRWFGEGFRTDLTHRRVAGSMGSGAHGAPDRDLRLLRCPGGAGTLPLCLGTLSPRSALHAPNFLTDLKNILITTFFAVLFGLVVGFLGALAIARFRFFAVTLYWRPSTVNPATHKPSR